MIDHCRSSGLLRIAELQQLLAKVCAGEQPDDRLRRILKSLLQIDLVLELAFRVPLRHFGDRLRIARHKMKYQEAFHPGFLHYQAEIVFGPTGFLSPRLLYCEIRSAQHDARAEGQSRERMIEDLAAHVVEIHIDTLRAMLGQRLADILILIVNRGVEAGLFQQPVAFLASSPRYQLPGIL